VFLSLGNARSTAWHLQMALKDLQLWKWGLFPPL
jgi:hypothetical protein